MFCALRQPCAQDASVDAGVDHLVGIGSLVLVRNDRIRTEPLAARVGGDTDVAVVGGVLAARAECGRVRVDIDCQQRRQRLRNAFLAQQRVAILDARRLL
jgi:hypothetical protein